MRDPTSPTLPPIPVLPEVLARASEVVATIGSTSDAMLAKMGALTGTKPITLAGVAGHAANFASGVAGGAGHLAGQAATAVGTGIGAALGTKGAGQMGPVAGSPMAGIGLKMGSTPSSPPNGLSGAGAAIAGARGLGPGTSPMAGIGLQMGNPSALPSIGLSSGANQIAGAAGAVMGGATSLAQANGVASVFDMASNAAGMVQNAVLGVTQILQINQFVRGQVDMLIGGISPQSRMIRDWTTTIMIGSWARVDTIMDAAARSAKQTLKEISDVPQKASELVVEAKEIKKTALARRDALRKHAARFRARRGTLSRFVAQHFEEFSVEIEAELEQDAVAAEKFGEKVEKDSTEFYDKTVLDAKHYSARLITQTEQNVLRARQLKRELLRGIDATKAWSQRHVDRVAKFKSERMASIRSLASIQHAQIWAGDTISGAHALFADFLSDVAQRPSEVMSFGQHRVNEAMQLAQGIRQEVSTAADWARTQKGTNAAWKTAMKENRQSAESFLKGQSSRVLMKISQHGEEVGEVARDLGEDQIRETAKELGKSPGEAQKSIDEAGRATKSDRDAVEDDLSDQSVLNMPEMTHRMPEVDANIPIEMDLGDISEDRPPIAVEQPVAGGAAKGAPAKESKSAQSGATAKKGESPAKAKPPETAKQTPAKTAVPSAAPAETAEVKRGPENKAAPGGKPDAKSAEEPKKAETQVDVAKPSPPAAPSGPVPVPYPNAGPPDKVKGPTFKPDSAVEIGKRVQAIPTTPLKAAKPSGNVGNNVAATSKTKEAGSAAPSPVQKKPEGSSPPAEDTKTKPLGAMAPPNTALKPEADRKRVAKKEAMALHEELPKQAVQRKSTGPEQPQDPAAFKQRLLSASGTGTPPDPDTREQLKKHVGFDPVMVRFHTSPAAALAAAGLGAEAFAVGHHVFFGAGKYDPKTPEGLGLIGHEVTHVGQQLGLRGDKLRFNTKTGGDAMEQEAQEVGERIVANVSFAPVGRVGRYVRVYEPADDEPITTAVQIRLDRISMSALRAASKRIARNNQGRPIHLDEVQVDVALDLESMSDQEAIEVWAEAIATAIESAPRASSAQFELNHLTAPTTHILQMRLGDEGAKKIADETKKLDEATLARLAKVTASAQDKDMIRKLLVREKVDPLIDAADKRVKDAKDSRARSMPPGGGVSVPKMDPIEIKPEEKAAIEAALKESEINSVEEYEKLKKDFIAAFGAKGLAVTHFILDYNLKILLDQKGKYKAEGKDDPNSNIRQLKEAAKAIAVAQDAAVLAISQMITNIQERTMGPGMRHPTMVSLDSWLDWNKEEGFNWSAATKEETERADKAVNDWRALRKTHGDKHPLLLGRDFDPRTIADKNDFGEIEMDIVHKFLETEKSIKTAKSQLNQDKFWELKPMVEMTKSSMGIRPGEGADKTVKEGVANKQGDATLWNMIQAAAAIALAITAMYATGGLAAVALVASAGLSVYGAAKHLEEYSFKKAAVQSSLDQATLISKDDPALLWLALDLVAAGMDLGAAVGAFKTLANIAKAAAAERSALKELEAAARAQYSKLGSLPMSEDQFVARLLESAKKGTKGAEDAVKQIKLTTELLEATSPRAVAILKGDKAAIVDLVKEYGNWKGMMGALTNGGEDGAKMAKNIQKVREGIVDDIAKNAKGSGPLEDASNDIVSDYDINFKPTAEKGAGELMIEEEARMAKEYGPNWSAAWNMNFYTDKSQLMAIEQALKMVSPQKRAQLLKEITAKAEKLNFAKMVEHAHGDPTALKEVEDMMKAAGVKYDVAELQKLAKEIKDLGRDKLLKECDELAAKLKNAPPDQQAALAEQLTKKQMEANFLTTEAYIGPAAVKGGVLSNAEAYQSALSQLEMMRHVISSCGGDVLKACREYEFFKYVSRYVAAAEKAGVKSPGLKYFEGLSNYVYKRARSAHMETGGLPGVSVADEATDGLVTEKFLAEQYNAFRAEVNASLPKLKQAAEANPAGGWRAEMKTPRPAAGEPAPGAPKGTPDSGPPSSGAPSSQPPSTKPGGAGPPSSGPATGLPAASAKHEKAAAAMNKQAGKKVPAETLDESKKLSSAGFKGSGEGVGVGVYKTTIPGVPHPVVVKMYPSGQAAKMESELAAAIAAEKSGFGPKVHGKVNYKPAPDAPDRVGFAMDEVKGGFADEAAAHADAAVQAANKAEMLKNAENIKPVTFEDLNGFREGMFKEGFYYDGELQGFVDDAGRWKPVDVQGASPLSKASSIEEARKVHDKTFDEMVDRLLQRSIEAKTAAAKKAAGGS